MLHDDAHPPVALEELVGVIGASVGDEKAREVLLEAARGLGLDPRAMTRQEALALLESLAHTPGIIGVSSRFGRSRLLLKWARDNLRAFR